MIVAKRNQDLIPSLFNELFDLGNWGSRVSDESRYSTPKMNVSEDETAYAIDLCVPGLSKDDMTLSIDTDNNLVVEMVKKEEAHDDKVARHYLRHEFGTMQFKQMMTLPENVKKEQIHANVENGILHITLPKLTDEEKKSLAQTIEIC